MAAAVLSGVGDDVSSMALPFPLALLDEVDEFVMDENRRVASF